MSIGKVKRESGVGRSAWPWLCTWIVEGLDLVNGTNQIHNCHNKNIPSYLLEDLRLLGVTRGMS